MRKIILANGAEYPCEWCAVMDGMLDMNLVTDAGLPALAAAFGDPANTARIEQRGGGDLVRVYEGFTELCTLSAGAWKPGSVLVMLKGGTQNG